MGYSASAPTTRVLTGSRAGAAERGKEPYVDTAAAMSRSLRAADTFAVTPMRVTARTSGTLPAQSGPPNLRENAATIGASAMPVPKYVARSAHDAVWHGDVQRLGLGASVADHERAHEREEGERQHRATRSKEKREPAEREELLISIDRRVEESARGRLAMGGSGDETVESIPERRHREEQRCRSEVSEGEEYAGPGPRAERDGRDRMGRHAERRRGSHQRRERRERDRPRDPGHGGPPSRVSNTVRSARQREGDPVPRGCRRHEEKYRAGAQDVQGAIHGVSVLARSSSNAPRTHELHEAKLLPLCHILRSTLP
jgi:hypothetical protein